MAIPVATKSNTTDIIDAGESPAEYMVSRVSEQGAARIMSMVVDMYSDPCMAVVREYIANAVDATIVAGTGIAVQVTVPTVMDPNFIVTDKGTGIDKDGLESAFLAFAASTKTDTNDLVGYFGVGAKSAWTVCESFIVDTIKDGKRNVVRASRDLKHEVLVSDANTDSENGTTITVPVNPDAANWSQLINTVASAHKQGAVVVDGKDVRSIHSRTEWIGPVHFADDTSTRSWERNIHVVSGGTLFGVPEELRKMINDIVPVNNLVIKLDIGSFECTPSREYLIPTETTVSSVKSALDEYKKKHDALQRRLVKIGETDPFKAMAKRAEALGDAQGDHTILPTDYFVYLSAGSVYRAGKTRNDNTCVWQSADDGNIALRHSHNTLVRDALVITGVRKGMTIKGIGRYMRAYFPTKRTVLAVTDENETVEFSVHDKGLRHRVDASSATTLPKFTVSAKTKGMDTVAWEDMRAEMKVLAEKAKANRVTTARRYRTYTYIGGDANICAMTLAQVRQLIDANPAIRVFHSDWSHRSVPSAVLADGDGGVIVVYSEQYSVNPIIKAIPESGSLREHVVKVSDAIFNSASDITLMAALLSSISAHNGHVTAFTVGKAVFDAVGESHPAHEIISVMAQVIAERDTNREEIARLEKARRSVNDFHIGDRAYDLVGGLVSKLYGMYPLLRGNYGADNEHLIAYVTHVPPIAS